MTSLSTMPSSPRALFLITARGGSKGVPGKNIKPLQGKPLIYWTIDAAREVASDRDILVSTDDEKIRQAVVAYGLEVPFLRPAELATDTAGSHEVIVHALDAMAQAGQSYDVVVLLQPTSPFRTGRDIAEALMRFGPEVDMVVGVRESEATPYFNLYEETVEGFLIKSKESGYTRRQDCPPVYYYNGSIYVIDACRVRNTWLHALKRVRKYVMGEIASLQIDTPLDWRIAEAVATDLAQGASR